MKCYWHEPAMSQRENELRDYGTDRGCEGFKKMGCYECPGDNKSCSHYIDEEVLEQERQEGGK